MVLDNRTIKREGIKRRKIFVNQTCQQSLEKREGSSFPVCWMMKSPKKAKNFCCGVLGCGRQDPLGVLRFQGGMPGPGRDQGVLPVSNGLDTPKSMVCKVGGRDRRCGTNKALVFPGPFSLGAESWLFSNGAFQTWCPRMIGEEGQRGCRLTPHCGFYPSVFDTGGLSCDRNACRSNMLPSVCPGLTS